MPEYKNIRWETALLWLWFILNLSIGALTVHNYSVSLDEPGNYRYAAYTLDAYPSVFGIRYQPKYDHSFDGHGPAFVTIVAVVIKAVQGIFPNVFTPDIWHFSYFVAFQLTGLCLYILTKRWFSKWTAWSMLVLFTTQPLLMGHAFINPKDIPFMFLLTLSIMLGFRLTDSIAAKEPSFSLQGPIATLVDKFREADPVRRQRYITYLVLALALVAARIVFSSQIHSLIDQVIAYFYTAPPNSWAGKIFGAAASHASNVPAKDYATKTIRLFRRLGRDVLITGMLFFLAYFSLLLGNITLPAFLRKLWNGRHRLAEFIIRPMKALQNSLKPDPLKKWFAEILQALRNPGVIFTGVALGMATSVRAIGPLAGAIVFLYLFAKVRAKAWAIAIAYFLIAAIVTYLMWPHLWPSPIQRYLEALGVISDFPWPGRVLFNGNLYYATDLPRSYLPVLLNIQFTEPLVLCVYIGLGIMTWQLLRSHVHTDLLLYIGLGFAGPLLGLIALDSTLYNNFRQILFLMPAMFMLAAFTLELIFNKLSQSWVRILLIAALALPGVYASVKLYPYEYVYYNSLVGGPANVGNRYELDYWRTSLREVALELNQLAPYGAKILVVGTPTAFKMYIRPDLIVEKLNATSYDLNGGYNYGVQLARWEAWDIYPKAKDVIVIKRDGAVLATVKAAKNASFK